MRAKIIAVGCLCLATGCAHHKGGDVGQPPPDDDRTVDFVTIDPGVFKELGIDPNEDVLLTLQRGRPATVFLAPGQEAPKAMDIPPGRALEGFTQIFKLRSSPVCNWVHDGLGGRAYYPLPPGCEIPP